MADTNGFWTTAGARDPKRGFRFRVSFAGGTNSVLNGIAWYAKKATKPSVSFSEASHQYLNHTYYWPARTEWNEVDITFVDPVEPDLCDGLTSLIESVGYVVPAGGAFAPADFSTVSKSRSVAALGNVQVEQIDEDGAALETWTLNNGWVKELTFGDLDYGSDDLTEVTMKIRYDWASVQIRNAVTKKFSLRT